MMILAYLLTFQAVLSTGMVSSVQARSNSTFSNPINDYQLNDLVEILSESRTARDLLDQAVRHWGLKGYHELSKQVKLSEISKTDAVVIRSIDPKTGEERRERSVVIYLNETQPVVESALDLVHEITHATATMTWDPYDPKLDAAHYIWIGIEGEGGEVDAVMKECEVFRELKERKGASANTLSESRQKRCSRYAPISSSGEVLNESPSLRAKVVQDFYRVGEFHKMILSRLGEKVRFFPYLNSQSPNLYSSTGRAPYPVALYDEFLAMNEVACQNSKKRLQTIARAVGAATAKKVQATREFLFKRCK
jgi:hypothetical protein